MIRVSAKEILVVRMAVGALASWQVEAVVGRALEHALAA